MSHASNSANRLRIAVLVSGRGRGTNLQAILDACADSAFPAQVALVVGTKDDAPALDRARDARIPALTISSKSFEADEGYGLALLNALESAGVGLVCLAGYMRILPSSVIGEYRNRIINVHPALLPFFGGKGMFGHHVHEAVVASGMKVAGCTVHFVDEEYDSGPIILQRCIRMGGDDTAESLAARILIEEHACYVDAIRLIAEGRVSVEGGRVRIRESTNG